MCVLFHNTYFSRTHESCVVYKVIRRAGLSLDDINKEELYDYDGQSIYRHSLDDGNVEYFAMVNSQIYGHRYLS